jgi:hypothetical protein
LKFNQRGNTVVPWETLRASGKSGFLSVYLRSRMYIFPLKVLFCENKRCRPNPGMLRFANLARQTLDIPNLLDLKAAREGDNIFAATAGVARKNDTRHWQLAR